MSNTHDILGADVVFQAINTQHESCGVPPRISNHASNIYHAYFENRYGEQLVFVFDFDGNGEGILYHGDAGWDRSYRVVDGKAINLILDNIERAWVECCWLMTRDKTEVWQQRTAEAGNANT